MPDGQEQEDRDHMLRADCHERLVHGISKDTGNRGSAERYKWIDEYDATREVAQALLFEIMVRSKYMLTSSLSCRHEMFG